MPQLILTVTAYNIFQSATSRGSAKEAHCFAAP